MRRTIGAFVLAAVIATPGVVVAATSSGGHSAPPIGYSATIESMAPPSGPINPALRPAVNAVKSALAAKSIELTVQPLGGEAAEGFALDASRRCPIVIVFSLGRDGGNLSTGPCSSRGSIGHDQLTITYTPASVGPTIEAALATLSGASAGATAYAPVVQVDPSLQPAFDAVLRALKAQGFANLETTSYGTSGAEIQQTEEPGRPCPVHINFLVGGIEMWDSNGCDDRSIERGDIRIRYSPASLGPLIRKALAGLPLGSG